MSTLKTVDDLRADALFRAGEPQDSSSSFWTKSLEYLNHVQQQLLLGGAVAEGRDLATSAGIYAHLVDLPITDWWWARKRGVFNSEVAIEKTVDGALAVGDTTIDLTSAITVGTQGWAVLVGTQPTVYRVARVENNGQRIILDAAYVDDAQTDATITLVKTDYTLAPDFLRLCSTPYRHAAGGACIDVSSTEQRNMASLSPIVRRGIPSRAFMVGTGKVALDSYDTRPYRFEYEYVAMPTDLRAGGYPMLPEHHRGVLSAGAAMMMLFDSDDSKTTNMASMYRELVGRMVQEHRRAMSGGSATFGQFRFRQGGALRRAPQTLGELYLV